MLVSQMIDIHCHILPALDDGADSFEAACAMAEMAIEDGVTHIVGTPHANSAWKFEPSVIRQRRDELQARFEGRLQFATGCDFHMSFENLREIQQNSTMFTINQRNYLLVEFADYSIPPSMDQALHQLQLAGLSPVVTHPERNPLIRAQPERLFRWLHQGCYAQITAQSFLGKWGEAAKERAEEWLAAGAVHFIASDAHNVTTRPLRLKETYQLIAKTHGEAKARALLLENPLAAFEGRPLPYVPELDEEQEKASGAGEGNWRKRLWPF